MSEQNFLKEENLLIFKEIEASPIISQRHLATKLGVSLGKINYLLKELIRKGFIEVRNFSNNPGKLKKINYILTKKGMEHKVQLLSYFLKLKEVEYNAIRQEWERLVVKNT